MSLFKPVKEIHPGKLIGWFLLLWTVLNTLQAATLGLHSDEAYYWIYSRLLDWGYYDHPPMVAIFIRIGDTLIPWNELGVRLVTVITSTLTVYLLWLIAKRYRVDARWFIVIVSGIFAFHIYGFMTTPDAPLLFFTVLFYYLYQKYLQQDSWPLALLIALVVACLLYSKYHAVLVLGCTVLANLKLFKRPTFYAIIILAAVLYLPHVWWQVQHGYPSVNYHLHERSSQVYQFAHTYQFVPGQLLMAGPLIGWFLFYYAFGIRIKDAFIRCLTVNGIGTLLFFFASTYKGNVQPHWTLIAFVPLALLTLIRLKQAGAKPLWLYRLAVTNTIIIVLIRLLLISNIPAINKLNFLKSYHGYREWAKQVKQRTGDAYVLTPAGFQTPSKYNYYTRTLKAFSYDKPSYRRTQYDIWPIEDSLQQKRTYWLKDDADPVEGLHFDTIKTLKGNWYGAWVDDTRTYQRVYITTDNYTVKSRPGEKLVLPLTITNPYATKLNFGNEGSMHPVVLEGCFLQDEVTKQRSQTNDMFNRIVLEPHQTTHYNFTLNAPMKKGAYELIFSLRTTPFPGGRNSRIINFTVQ
jgi:hypothetical protein